MVFGIFYKKRYKRIGSKSARWHAACNVWRGESERNIIVSGLPSGLLFSGRLRTCLETGGRVQRRSDLRRRRAVRERRQFGKRVGKRVTINL
jgi:hypothetical protein